MGDWTVMIVNPGEENKKGITTEEDAGPIPIELIPDIKMDLRGLVKYANSVGKTVPDLSDDEVNPFIRDSTMEDVRKERKRMYEGLELLRKRQG